MRFFSEFSSASQLTDEEAVERGIFLVRHMPPQDYFKLKVKGKFVQLAKKLNSVIDYCLSIYIYKISNYTVYHIFQIICKNLLCIMTGPERTAYEGRLPQSQRSVGDGG